MSTYTYLTDTKSIQKLSEYISLSLPDLKNITYDKSSRNTDIVFLSSLSPEDQALLDGLIDAYPNPEEVINNRLEQISSVEMTSDVQFWKTLISWEETTQIKSVHIYAKLVPSPDDYLYNEDFKYSIRLVDTTNNTVIGAETDYTNSEYAMLDVPITDLIIKTGVNIEIQVKKYNKGDSVRIFNCNSHY